MAAVPDQFSLRDRTPHVLLTADVSDKVRQRDQALEAGVHVADLGWVWKPDTQTQHVNIRKM